jgi:hypothetical protein
VPVQVVIRPQQYALLLLGPRRAIAVYQVLADVLGVLRRRRYRRRVLGARLQTRGALRMRHGVRLRTRAVPDVRVQSLLGVARLALLALAHPVDFAERAQDAGAVLGDGGAVEDAGGACAGRDGVGRCEGVRGRRGRRGRRHGGRRAVRSLLTLGWEHTALRDCLVDTRGRNGW